MFNISAVLLAFSISLITRLIGDSLPTSENHIFLVGFSVVALIVGCLWLFISLIVTFAMYNEQLNDFQTLIGYSKKHKQTSDYVNLLTTQFKTFLIDKYPDMEKDVVEKMIVAGSIIVPPQLEASVTIIDYTNKLRQLHNQLLEVNERLINQGVSIRQYESNVWSWFKVKTPINVNVIINMA